MKNIIDESLSQPKSIARTKIAYNYFLFNLLLFVLMLCLTYFWRNETEAGVIGIIFMILVGLFCILGIIGFVNAILSVIKKEKWSSKKMIGLVGNSLFFGIILLLIFANVLDIIRFLKGV